MWRRKEGGASKKQNRHQGVRKTKQRKKCHFQVTLAVNTCALCGDNDMGDNTLKLLDAALGDLGDLLSFTLGLDVNEENLSLRLALCNRSIDPSGDGLYPSDLPTFARVVHLLLDQSSRPPIRVPAGLWG